MYTVSNMSHICPAGYITQHYFKHIYIFTYIISGKVKKATSVTVKLLSFIFRMVFLNRREKLACVVEVQDEYRMLSAINTFALSACSFCHCNPIVLITVVQVSQVKENIKKTLTSKVNMYFSPTGSGAQLQSQILLIICILSAFIIILSK